MPISPGGPLKCTPHRSAVYHAGTALGPVLLVKMAPHLLESLPLNGALDWGQSGSCQRTEVLQGRPLASTWSTRPIATHPRLPRGTLPSILLPWLDVAFQRHSFPAPGAPNSPLWPHPHTCRSSRSCTISLIQDTLGASAPPEPHREEAGIPAHSRTQAGKELRAPRKHQLACRGRAATTLIVFFPLRFLKNPL